MGKRLLLVCVGILTLSTVASASSFWGLLVGATSNSGSFQWSGQSGNSNYSVSGIQGATVTGSGTGLVLQGEGAAGFQDDDPDSQQQGMIAGQGQLVSNSGQGTATGWQIGTAGQTQTATTGSATATQSQYVGGLQFGTVTGTGSGSQGTVVQTAVVQTFQFQSY